MGATHGAFTVVLVFAAPATSCPSCTQSAGDIILIQVCADTCQGVADKFTILPLCNIAAGTKLFATDDGWYASGSWRTFEGRLEYDVPSSGHAAGVPLTGPSGWTAVAGRTSFAFSASGDQLTVGFMNGGSEVRAFAAQLDSSGWQANSTSSLTSAKPDGALTVALGLMNAAFTGLTGGSPGELLANAQSNAQWNISGNPVDQPNVDVVCDTDAPSRPPSASPSTAPSKPPSVGPSIAPSRPPSASPSTAPSKPPSVGPSTAPSIAPTQSPTNTPSMAPSTTPTAAPSTVPPSVAPSHKPTLSPSAAPNTPLPSAHPSSRPTLHPMAAPSTTPSVSPTRVPTAHPSADPTTASPSVAPSPLPSSLPTLNPSGGPSVVPSRAPSTSPTLSPVDTAHAHAGWQQVTSQLLRTNLVGLTIATIQLSPVSASRQAAALAGRSSANFAATSELSVDVIGPVNDSSHAAIVLHSDAGPELETWESLRQGVPSAVEDRRVLVTVSTSDDRQVLNVTIRSVLKGYRLRIPYKETFRLELTAAAFEDSRSYAAFCQGRTPYCAPVTLGTIRGERPFQVPPDTQQVMDQSERTVQGVAAMGAVVSGALGGGSPAANVGRQGLVQGVLSCPPEEPDTPERMEMSLSPLQLGFGAATDTERYARGAVVGSFMIIGGLSVFTVLGLCRAEYDFRTRCTTAGKLKRKLPTRSLRAYLILARIPSLLLPHSLLYPGVAMAAVRIAANDSSLGYIVLGVAGLVAFVVIPVGYMAYAAWTVPRFAAYDSGTGARRCSWLLWGSLAWRPLTGKKTINVLEKVSLHAMVFQGYRDGLRRYTLLFELCYTVLLAIVSAWTPDHLVGCQAQAITLGTIPMLWAIYIGALRPYIAPYENALDCLIALVESLMIAVTYLGMLSGPDTWHSQTAGLLSMLATWAIGMKSFIDQAVFLYDQYELFAMHVGHKTSVFAFAKWFAFFQGYITHYCPTQCFVCINGVRLWEDQKLLAEKEGRKLMNCLDQVADASPPQKEAQEHDVQTKAPGRKDDSMPLDRTLEKKLQKLKQTKLPGRANLQDKDFVWAMACQIQDTRKRFRAAVAARLSSADNGEAGHEMATRTEEQSSLKSDSETSSDAAKPGPWRGQQATGFKLFDLAASPDRSSPGSDACPDPASPAAPTTPLLQQPAPGVLRASTLSTSRLQAAALAAAARVSGRGQCHALSSSVTSASPGSLCPPTGRGLASTIGPRSPLGLPSVGAGRSMSRSVSVALHPRSQQRLQPAMPGSAQRVRPLSVILSASQRVRPHSVLLPAAPAERPADSPPASRYSEFSSPALLSKSLDGPQSRASTLQVPPISSVSRAHTATSSSALVPPAAPSTAHSSPVLQGGRGRGSVDSSATSVVRSPTLGTSGRARGASSMLQRGVSSPSGMLPKGSSSIGRTPPRRIRAGAPPGAGRAAGLPDPRAGEL